jgi:hypothetical protein
MAADRKDDVPSPLVAALLAWIVPGLGHWYLGRRTKAAVFAGCILALLLAGTILGQWRVVNFGDRILFIGQALSGLPALALGLVTRHMMTAAGPPNVVLNSYEMGVLYTLVAGLLNLLVTFDAYIQGHDLEQKALGRAESGKAG